MECDKPANLTPCNLTEEAESVCLFDLEKDPCEYNNIAEDHPQIVQFLMSRLHYYNSTAVEPLDQPGDPAADPALHGNVWQPWRSSKLDWLRDIIEQIERKVSLQ